MLCPDCSKEAVFITINNGKEEYFCPHCKIYFTKDADDDTINAQDIEIDDSEFEYDGDFDG